MKASRVDGVRPPEGHGTPRSYMGFTVEATDAIATRKPTKDRINAARNEPPSMPAVGPFSATQQKINKNKGADR